MINPPELGILEHEIKRIPKGRALVIPPPGDKTHGHGSHRLDWVLWKDQLAELLAIKTVGLFSG
jgi:homoserine O-acetyltransferase